MAEKKQKPEKHEKQRLDALLFERGLVESRELARRLVMEGNVTVAGQMVDKPGTRVADNAVLAVRALPRFVSRGGEKLDKAMIAFNINAEGVIAVDVGASTGGFTDCLLQRGAQKVYALDVGYGQLDYRLRHDPRVVVMERTNARYVESLPDHPALAVIDASFISLKLLLPPVKRWLTETGQVIALIKPQFEAGREKVGKGGVVKDHLVHAEVLRDVLLSAQANGFMLTGLIRSPLKGPAGNIEFLAYLQLGMVLDANNIFDLEAAIFAAMPTEDELLIVDPTEME
jgi:23S rRNA (cytidine1920-2'-O)/16S rRNA (cytidine1409-2'-O)-methyltransferase